MMAALGAATLALLIHLVTQMPLPMEPDLIRRLPAGDPISPPQLWPELAARRLVLVGETHDDPGHHALQLTVIRELARDGRATVVALEMFPRPLQPHLDRWGHGDLEESAFLDAVEWYFTWGFDAGLYLPILRHARDHGVPLLALNAPRELVSAVRELGLDGLPEERRAGLPPIAPPPREYEISLHSVFQQHPMMAGRVDFGRFVAAQQVWDATMADALLEHLTAHPERRIVALVGSGHLLRGHGIPHQLRSRGWTDFATLLPWSTDADWVPPDAADYAWGTPPPPAVPPSPRIGVVLELDQAAAEGPEGVTLQGVGPDSPAARAGLAAGDRILAVNGQPVAKRHVLVRLLRERPVGQPLRLTVTRKAATGPTEVLIDPRP
ncbi:MAG: ChaN family lipoprotein [Magnetococcales bacterium]|nr:ChaN family lipoprotein [Magnetococcales bacterium]